MEASQLGEEPPKVGDQASRLRTQRSSFQTRASTSVHANERELIAESTVVTSRTSSNLALSIEESGISSVAVETSTVLGLTSSIKMTRSM